MVHVVGTRHEELLFADLTVMIHIYKRLFGTEITDITGKENTLQFLRVFVLLLSDFSAVHKADP